MNFIDIVGVTGLFCSGKSTVDNILKNEFNYNILDLDKIGHIALEEKKIDIINIFGDEIVIDNKIDRKKLGKIVFNDKKKLISLNRIVWPFMKEYVQKKIYELKYNRICISGAVLFEMGLDTLCNKIFVIQANIFTILKRAKLRNNYSFFKTLSIITKQKVIKLSKKSDKNTEIIYINNDSNIETLKESLKKYIER